MKLVRRMRNNMPEMVRTLIAIAAFCGFIAMLGAVGGIECGETSWGEALPQMIIGGVVFFAGLWGASR